MLSEHDDGRGFCAAMRDAAAKLIAGDRNAAAAVVENARQYVNLMRHHIYKEDHVLFMVAERVLGDLQRAAVAETFQLIETETELIRSKYVRLAQELEREIGPRGVTA
jgi:hemerythrin-like domain-containing protein